MNAVLFACVHNAGRSQMAAALFNLIADPTKARAISAGTDPAREVHPVVVQAMRELGVDLSRVTPRKLNVELAGEARHVVTMGCGEECPVVPHATREDWTLEDPRGKELPRVREIREEIQERIEDLVRRNGWGKPLR